MKVTQLAVAAWPARALSVAARLGIADIIDDRSVGYEEIAHEAKCVPNAVQRLLQVLAGAGVFAEEADGRFRNNDQSDLLRTGHPASMRYVCMLAGEMYYDAFGGLLATVQTGESGFERVFGVNIYQHMERDPDAAFVYNKAMEAIARPVAAEVARSFDFSAASGERGAPTIVDVGGGFGGLIKGILLAHPQARGVCVDRESVCDQAREDLHQHPQGDLPQRLEYRPGDFFDSVPPRADRYLLKNVLHNWNPESGARILATIRAAMGEGSRLLVIEPLADTGEQDALGVLFQMVVCEDGAERYQREEMYDLLGAAGFTVRSDTRLATRHTVFECELA